MFATTDIFWKRKIWLRWLFTNTVGIPISLLVGLLVQAPFNSFLEQSLVDPAYTFNYTTIVLISLALIGTIIGSVQLWVLRVWIKKPISWIIASGLGYMIAAILPFRLKLADMYFGYYMGRSFQLDEVLYGAAFGALLGIAQWIVLRRHLKQSGWWIPASSIGYLLGYSLGELLPLSWEWPGTGIIYTILIYLPVIAITGFVLVHLLKTPPITDIESLPPHKPESL